LHLYSEGKMTDKKKIPMGSKAAKKVNGELVTTCEVVGPVVLDLIRAGMTQQRAAEAVGLSKSAISNWVRRGLDEQSAVERGDKPNPKETIYMEFVQGMVKAEGEAQAALVLSWFKEARAGDWKAAERFLARRWPQEWGDSNTVKVEVSGGIGMSLNETPVPLTLQEDEDRKRAILEALVEAGDLPSNVLGAWDGNKDEDIIDAEVVDEQ
jgi:DNA-binding XRE family transcriptional regulator